MPSASDRQWVVDAVRLIQADAHRSADTHLIHVPLPAAHTVDLYLKDESTHPTGSLKHRLARSLFLYGLVDGQIGSGTTIVEASSGSTAVSEAYFARMLGLPFVAVMAATTSVEKITLIERTGGTCHLVQDPTTVYAVAQQLADDAGGIYLDQFTNAERATDWRGNNNIAESIFDQLAREPHPLPRWVVVGAGTGGTSATIGRFIRYQANPTTQLCVVDPEGSAFHPAWAGDAPGPLHGSRIEGIGRPRVEPSFRPDVIDAMMRVPDAASVAAMQLLRDRAGILAGPSTGTNIYGVLRLACEMAARGERGGIVSLVCDRSDRYEGTHCRPDWLVEHGLNPAPYAALLASAWDTAVWSSELPSP